jgi:hypothetical protein
MVHLRGGFVVLEGNGLRRVVAQLERRLNRLELEVLLQKQKSGAQRKRLQHILRCADGRFLQTWYRETGHDSMAQLMLTLPEDIIDRLRLSAPRSLWQHWIEAAKIMEPSPIRAIGNVAEALRALDALEEAGEILITVEGGKFVRPSRIGAVKGKESRGALEKNEKLKAHAARIVKRMNELL